MMDVRLAIETGDVEALRNLLDGDAALANALVVWGERCEIRTHPLHYVSDVFFKGKLEAQRSVELVDVLLAAGADVNYQASNGETALIGAASLHAEDVGLRLMEAGAEIGALGGGAETALHWAAHEGMKRLVVGLVRRGADLSIRDRRYGATPVEWARHGGHAGVVELLER